MTVGGKISVSIPCDGKEGRNHGAVREVGECAARMSGTDLLRVLRRALLGVAALLRVALLRVAALLTALVVVVVGRHDVVWRCWYAIVQLMQSPRMSVMTVRCLVVVCADACSTWHKIGLKVD